MRPYTKILIWENKRRLNRLMGFRKKVISYFNNCVFDRFGNGLEENEAARQARIDINKELAQVREIMAAAGVHPIIVYTPPPVIGGLVQEIDVILNVFNLQRYEISPKNITDHLERAIGIYENNRKAAKLGILNPFFYLGLILDYIVEFPFFLVGRIGFNRAKAESSTIGRIIKGLCYLLTVLAAAFAILYYLGYMESVRNFFRSFIERK